MRKSLEILEILPECFIFPSLSVPAPHYHALSFDPLSFFSPPLPYQGLWLIHFGYINKIFIYFPSPSHALRLWCILGISVKFFIFTSAPPPPLPSSVTLIHSEHIGKTFHFSLAILPPTMLCDFDLFGT